jgi:hypothetical protein
MFSQGTKLNDMKLALDLQLCIKMKHFVKNLRSVIRRICIVAKNRLLPSSCPSFDPTLWIFQRGQISVKFWLGNVCKKNLS